MKIQPAIGIVSLCIILLSCSPGNDRPADPAGTLPGPGTCERISITNVGHIQFTKSYSQIQSIHDEKEIEKYMEETDKSNPLLYFEYNETINETIRKGLEESGLVQGNELLLHKFEFEFKFLYELSFPGQAGKEIKARVARDSIGGGIDQDKVTVYEGTDSCEIKIPIGRIVTPKISDIIPGKNKELILLDEHYLSNTYIYTLTVYEIKTGKQ